MMAPYSIVSLWDMLQLPIGRVIYLYQRLVGLAEVLRIEASKQNVLFEISNRSYQELVADATEFLQICGEIPLDVTRQAMQPVCEELGRASINKNTGFWVFPHEELLRLYALMNSVLSCMQHETATKAAMVLPPEKLNLYSPSGPIWGADIAAKFPSALYDIDEAAKCLALGRSTACLFHLMRATEIALKAVAACIQATPPKNPNWGTWLKAINDARLARSPHGAQKWQENDLFQDFYLRLDAVREAQRNSTLHVERVYTEEEAQNVFAATKSFMEKVASRMDEQGQPLA